MMSSTSVAAYQDGPGNDPNGWDARSNQIHREISHAKKRIDILPPYSERFTAAVRIKGTISIALFTITVAGFLFLFLGSLINHPQNLFDVLKNVSPTELMIGGSVAIIWVMGAAFVIHRVKTKKDTFPKIELSPRHGPLQLEEVKFCVHKKDTGANTYYDGYIDAARLSPEGNGTTYLYLTREPNQHYFLTAAEILSTPVSLIGRLAMDAIRMVISPFFILGGWTVQHIQDPTLFKNHDPDRDVYQLKSIALEPAKSLWRIVKTPFYALAFLFLCFYSLGNPAEANDLLRKLELDWNEDVPRSYACWLTQGPQSMWPGWSHFTGKGIQKPIAIYIVGCMQPRAIATFDNGVPSDVRCMSQILDKKKNNVSITITRPSHVSLIETQIAELEREKQDIENKRMEYLRRRSVIA